MSTTNNSIYIFGCGGHARSIINSTRLLKVERNMILVDAACNDGERILGCDTIRENIFWEGHYNGEFKFIVGLGDNQRRKHIYEQAVHAGGIPQQILASSAIVGLESEIGEGCYVAERTYLGPETVIGMDSIINTGSVIEHETRVGMHTHCAPNTVICGRCIIGNNVFIGAGSTVIDGITVVDDVAIGAGSVVVKDILEKGVYAGCPVRKIHDQS